MPRHEPTGATRAPGDDYAAQFNPGFALDPARVALVVVDMQYASGSRKEGLGRLLAEQGNEAQGAYRFDRIEGTVVPTISRLLEFFRARFRQKRIVSEHFHSKRQRAFGDFAADAAHAEDAECFAREFDALKLFPVPFARDHRGVGLRNFARKIQ